MVLSEKPGHLPDEVSSDAEQDSPTKLTSGAQTPRLSAEQSLGHHSIQDLDIERNASPSSDAAASARDEFEVWWEDPADQDPENPMNWTNTRKIITIITISFVTFLTCVSREIGSQCANADSCTTAHSHHPCSRLVSQMS